MYTDEDGSTVCPAANTEEGFQRRLARAEAKLRDESDYMRGYRQRVEEMHRRYYRSDPASDERKMFRWGTAEWAYELFEVPEPTRALAAPATFDLDGFYAQVRIRRPLRFITKVLTDVLADLDDEGIFGAGAEREKVVLFVSVSDCDATVRIENRSARRLNSKASLREFLDRNARFSLRGYFLLYLPGLIAGLFGLR